MAKYIEINECRGCPYLRSDRHYFCGKKYRSNPEAYKAGAYAENAGELKWLFSTCPLPDSTKIA